MQYSSYQEYLQSDQWRSIRHRTVIRDERRCRNCGYDELLQVHHLTYARIYREKLEDLLTLCDHCHLRVEKAIKAKKLTRDGEVEQLLKDTMDFLRHGCVGETVKFERCEVGGVDCRNPTQRKVMSISSITKAMQMERKEFRRWLRKNYKDDKLLRQNALVLYDRLRKDGPQFSCG